MTGNLLITKNVKILTRQHCQQCISDTNNVYTWWRNFRLWAQSSTDFLPLPASTTITTLLRTNNRSRGGMGSLTSKGPHTAEAVVMSLFTHTPANEDRRISLNNSISASNQGADHQNKTPNYFSTCPRFIIIDT
jgi:hypothetical protein